MLNVKLICVGKLRESYLIEAFREYSKRLGAYCRFECAEIPEQRLPDHPAPKEIAAALEHEAAEVLKAIPPAAFPQVRHLKIFPKTGNARDADRERINSTKHKTLAHSKNALTGAFFCLPECLQFPDSIHPSRRTRLFKYVGNMESYRIS